MQRKFGNNSTKTKLQTLNDYANFYTKALKPHGFRLKYLDAFAGSGEIPSKESLPMIEGLISPAKLMEGSARRMLQLDTPFDEYVFCDLKKSNTHELNRLKAEFPALEDRISVWHDDANEAVKRFCNQLGKYDRAVVFLDPFGNQVSWETLRILAGTKRVDLWYLFPAGWGVHRQISNDGRIVVEAEASLDRLFGETDWREKWIVEENEGDLFNHDRIVLKKVATADSITEYMITRMKSIFEGGVLDAWLPLGKDGFHGFSLIFAWSNPDAKAQALASRVARDIMSKGK